MPLNKQFQCRLLSTKIREVQLAEHREWLLNQTGKVRKGFLRKPQSDAREVQENCS